MAVVVELFLWEVVVNRLSKPLVSEAEDVPPDSEWPVPEKAGVFGLLLLLEEVPDVSIRCRIGANIVEEDVDCCDADPPTGASCSIC